MHLLFVLLSPWLLGLQALGLRALSEYFDSSKPDQRKPAWEVFTRRIDENGAPDDTKSTARTETPKTLKSLAHRDLVLDWREGPHRAGGIPTGGLITMINY